MFDESSTIRTILEGSIFVASLAAMAWVAVECLALGIRLI